MFTILPTKLLARDEIVTTNLTWQAHTFMAINGMRIFYLP